jgi:archaellum component FlaC
MAENLNNLSKDQLIELIKLMGQENAEAEKLYGILNKQRSEAYKIVDAFRKGLDIQKDIKKDAGEYLKYIKKVKDIQKEIDTLSEVLTRQISAQSSLTGEEAKLNSEIVEHLRHQIKALKETKKLIVSQLEAANKMTLALKGAVSDIKAFGGGIKRAYNLLGINDMFKMVKSIKVSAMQMGVLSNQAKSFSNDIQAAALDTIQYGVGIEEIAKIQSSYSDELGRTVTLGKEGAKALAEMSVSAGLGEEGAAQFAANMDLVGFSAQRTGEYIEQVMNDAHAMGVNSSKVVKNIAGNIKLLNRFNFKGGTKGLAKMAESTTKIGVNMDLAASMAEKLFDIEGAVEMSAQLQVMGGEWSKLADPFKLMYMARNDMNGLTESIINATKSTAQFNKETGEFDISGLELHRLRKIAEATGLDFEQLATSAKKAAKFAAIKGQIGVDMDEDTKKFIEGTATLDENKKAIIRIDGVDKFVSALNSDDKIALKRIAAQKADMETRAKESVTFDEQLNFLKTMLKQVALPFVESLNDTFKPYVDRFVASIKNKEFLSKIKEWGEKVGKFIGGLGRFIDSLPKLAKAAAIIGGVLVLLQPMKWYLNGVALGQGFNSVAAAGGAGMPGMGGGFGGGMFGNGGKMATSMMKGMKGFGAGMLISGGLGLGRSFLNNPESDLGKVLGVGGTTASWAGTGALLGSIVPGVGNVVGGVLGGMAGLFKGIYDEYLSKNENGAATPSTTMNDGIVKFNKNDKFMKVNDSTMIAGTNENGNKDLAKAIMSSTAPGFGMMDYLMNKSFGSTKQSNTASNVPANIDVNLPELKVTGTIELKLDKYVNPDFAKQLLGNQSFVRDIAKAVNTATHTAITGKPA